MFFRRTATHSCLSTYTVQPGDTYFGVSQSQRMGTNDLISLNGLTFNQTRFANTSTLCINNHCSVYVVKANDTCFGIQTAKNISHAELTSWNPSINGLCSNLGDMVNQTICTSNPLGNFAASNVTGNGLGIFTTAAPVPSPLGPNTTTNCGRYFTILPGDDCSTVSLKFSIDLGDFIFLNPEVNVNCTNLWLDYNYCIAPVGNIRSYPGYPKPPTSTFSITPMAVTQIPWRPITNKSNTSYAIVPIAAGSRTDCWNYVWINATLSGTIDCWALASFSQIGREQFVLWNPSLNQNTGTGTPSYNYTCTIPPSLSYCVGIASPTPMAYTPPVPPSPRSPGEIGNCTDYIRAPKSPITCSGMLAGIRLSMSSFFAMNPSVKSDCSGIAAGTYYCIESLLISLGIGNSTSNSTGSITVSSPSSTSSGNGIATPTPLQAGMVANCYSFRLVASGDNCYSISTTAGITLTQFYAWNPAVQTDCSALFLAYYVCIGVAGAAPGTASASASASTSPSGNVSPTGLCGGTTGYTCAGSAFGTCCSSSGYCGDSSGHCGTGCQPEFGTCNISTNGLCGSPNGGMICAGSGFGNCCSSSGYCGSSSAYCGSGCQTAFGTCT
jgi:LysM repeat protein